MIKKHNTTLAALALFAVITFVAIAAPQVFVHILHDLITRR